MSHITDSPLPVFLLSFVAVWLSARVGTILRRRRNLAEDAREDFGVIQAATLTLLALIIGFSFSMAISRYDQRKNYEEEEANAIGTEYIRADLLAAADGAKVRTLLTSYLDLVVAGMNDVLNSQGYTQAAWWNRIPTAAWVLMVLIAVCSNVLVGYGAKSLKAGAILHLVLPLMVAISFALIADIDSPRGGVIRVNPQNLVSLADTLRQH